MPDKAKHVEPAQRPAGDAETRSDPLATAKELVELLSKGILGFAAVCFVCGMIVVNLYLRDFGVASFSLFRVSYITAGVWTFSPIVFAALVGGTFLMSVLSDSITAEDRPAKTPKRAGNLLTAGAVSIIVLLALFSALQLTFSWRWLVAILIGAVLGGLLAGTCFSVAQRDRRAGIVLGVACVLGLLFYLLHLAPTLYREIPASLGGGAGTPVVLVIPEDKQALVKAAGIPLGEPPMSKPVTLLIETDKTYVVVVGDSKGAITLNADLVSAIRHLPPQK
jgi:hypothetical protein